MMMKADKKKKVYKAKTNITKICKIFAKKPIHI